jgi:hypothetical protein
LYVSSLPITSSHSLQAPSILRVEVRPNGPSIDVMFIDASASPPFRIDNASPVPLVYRQAETDVSVELAPGRSAAFTWEDLSKVCYN